MSTIACLGRGLYPGNLTKLSGGTDGHVRVGLIATRGHSQPLLTECKARAASLGSPIKLWYECWPTTIAWFEDPSGDDLYGYIAYLARIGGDQVLKMTNGTPVATDWGRPFRWLDMRTTAPKAVGGPYKGLAPFEWLPRVVTDFAARRPEFDAYLWDGYPLRFYTGWLGGQRHHMPTGWEDEWKTGAVLALAARQPVKVVSAYDTGGLFPLADEVDGTMVEDAFTGWRRPMADDILALRAGAELRLAKTNEVPDDQGLVVMAAAALSGGFVAQFTPGANSHDTVVRQMAAIEHMQPYDAAGAHIQVSEWEHKPNALSGRIDWPDGRVVHLDLPARNVRGW